MGKIHGAATIPIQTLNPVTHPRTHTDPPPWSHPREGDEGDIGEKKKKMKEKKKRRGEKTRERKKRENIFLMREKNKEWFFFYAFLLQ